MDRVNKVTSECFNALGQLRDLDGPFSSPEMIHRRFCVFIDGVRERARDAGMPERDSEDIAYALAALADEIALSKPEPLHGFWMQRPLQLQYFNENRAGEGFFAKLDDLRRESRRGEVLRVFYLCLLFGFQGRYSIKGGDLELMKIIDSLRPEVEKNVEAADPLAPAGDAPDEALIRSSQRNPFLYVALGVFAVAIAVFIGLRISLDRQVTDLSDRVEELKR
jgi:type VI secretion system protein ImpK